jgi:hypothetical protein
MIAAYIRSVALDDLTRLGSILRERLLVGFRSKEAEADTKTRESWKGKLALPWNESFDPADDAEEAFLDGVDVVRELTAMEQATRNLLATWLYHLFEQHQEAYERATEHWKVRAAPFNKTFNTWPKVYELNMVANTAKHGMNEGSAKQLMVLRPDLFIDPILKKLGVDHPGRPGRAPLMGEGLFVEESDLNAYESAVRQLWEDIAWFHDRGEAFLSPDKRAQP